MSTNRIVWLQVLAVGIVQLQSAALAEETLRADTPRLDTTPVTKRAPLSGQISVRAKNEHVETHKAAIASPAPTKVVKAAPPKPTLSASASSFRGAPMQSTLDRNRDLMRGFTRDFNNYNPYAMRIQAQRPKWTNPDDAPYRWGQCGTGGYYDTTGIYKGPMVWGDKLAALGGRFFDGTPVPKGEVKINALGHIWWQNQLSNNFVKREDLRKQGFNE